MKIIISPAKKMNIENEISYRSIPVLIENTREIMTTMKAMTYDDLKSLWKCNDKLAQLNFDRFRNMDIDNNLSPAMYSYEGLQYQYIGANVLDSNSLEYLQRNLRILSGFYGVLKPFDGIVPYRLEMQASLSINGKKNMYDYWGNKIYNEIFKDNDIVINLASKEYSISVEKFLGSFILP